MTISMKQLTLLAETYNFDENEARILLGLPSKVRPKREEKPKPEEKPKKEDKPKKEEKPKKEDKPKKEEKPKQEEKSKPEDKPKGPIAYHSFIKANKELVKSQNFGMSAREVHNECIAKWKSLSKEEKETYRTKAIAAALGLP